MPAANADTRIARQLRQGARSHSNRASFTRHAAWRIFSRRPTRPAASLCVLLRRSPRWCPCCSSAHDAGLVEQICGWRMLREISARWTSSCDTGSGSLRQCHRWRLRRGLARQRLRLVTPRHWHQRCLASHNRRSPTVAKATSSSASTSLANAHHHKRWEDRLGASRRAAAAHRQ